MREQLINVTKENTSKLNQMNAFCIEKMGLESKLDALQNNLVSEMLLLFLVHAH